MNNTFFDHSGRCFRGKCLESSGSAEVSEFGVVMSEHCQFQRSKSHVFFPKFFVWIDRKQFLVEVSQESCFSPSTS